MLKRNIFFILFCDFLIAGSIQKLPTVTEIRGIDSKHITKASNGKLYIRNARVDTHRVENNQVSIKAGSDVRKVIISNVKIRSQNTSIRDTNTNNAILAITSNKHTDIEIKNMDIDSRNVKLITHARNTNVCAGALCIQSDNNNILLENINIDSTSLEAEVSTSGEGSKCAGALCIQSNNSVIELNNLLVKDTGTTLYKVKN